MLNFIEGLFVGAALMFMFYPIVKSGLDKLFKQND